MAFNRLRDLNIFREVRLSQEETSQAYLFNELDPPEQDTEPVVRRKEPPREERLKRSAPSSLAGSFGSLGEENTNRLMVLLDKCMEIVSRDPEVSLNGPNIEWESWFSQPLLSTIRRSNFPTGLKQRLLAFMALMLPFLDDAEQGRLRAAMAEIAPDSSNDFGEILTEQDLIHTQWLVQSIRRSGDIQNQMEGLRRSIERSLSTFRLV